MCWLLVEENEMFSFQQALTLRLIVDGCQQLKKLRLTGLSQVFDDDVIHVIEKLGKQLTTLELCGHHYTDDVYSYLNNCAR